MARKDKKGREVTTAPTDFDIEADILSTGASDSDAHKKNLTNKQSFWMGVNPRNWFRHTKGDKTNTEYTTKKGKIRTKTHKEDDVNPINNRLDAKIANKEHKLNEAMEKAEAIEDETKKAEKKADIELQKGLLKDKSQKIASDQLKAFRWGRGLTLAFIGLAILAAPSTGVGVSQANAISAKDGEIAIVQKENDKYKQDYESATESAKQFEDDLKDKAKENEGLKGEVADLTEQNKAQQGQIEDLTQQNAAQQGTIDELEGENDKLKQELENQNIAAPSADQWTDDLFAGRGTVEGFENALIGNNLVDVTGVVKSDDALVRNMNEYDEANRTLTVVLKTDENNEFLRVVLENVAKREYSENEIPTLVANGTIKVSESKLFVSQKVLTDNGGERTALVSYKAKTKTDSETGDVTTTLTGTVYIDSFGGPEMTYKLNVPGNHKKDAVVILIGQALKETGLNSQSDVVITVEDMEQA